MFYLAYVRTDTQGVIGATLPDFKLSAMADSVGELPDRLVEMIAAHYRGNAPKTSHLEDLQDDDAYQGGWWLFLNLDVAFLAGRRGRQRGREQ
jgi:hypothetical protein